MQRYFAKETINMEYNLPKEMYKHAVKVMRMTEGDKFELVDDQGRVFLMEIISIKNNEAVAQKTEEITKNVELPINVTIACGISKGDKAEFIVQKATEMGVKKIIFFNGDYSVAKWDDKRQKKKIERLTKVAQSASEQSHRNIIPEIIYSSKLSNIDLEEYDTRVVAYEESAKKGEKSTLYQVLNNNVRDLIAIFGPEGGISPSEIEMLEQNDFKLAGLGPRIMRAETAPLYLLASISFAKELS